MSKRKPGKSKRANEHDLIAKRFPATSRKGDALDRFREQVFGVPKQGGKVNPR
jgi:hypothetical protein